MGPLEHHRLALTAATSGANDHDLDEILSCHGSEFGQFVVDHGLGPLWHARTGHEMFRESRMAAEAFYLAQEAALAEITETLEKAGITHVVIKGGATRLLLYDPPALRACYDLDVLVAPEDRVTAARSLAHIGFEASPDPANISREVVLSRDPVDIDLHWSLLREGRLRDDARDLLESRRKEAGIWMLGADDAFFALLVHPAFGKHLSSWNMGLHRVADILLWLESQQVNWPVVRERLEASGVTTAAWATLCWVQMLTQENAPDAIESMMCDIQPARWRRRWLEKWLAQDLPRRYADKPWVRQLGFTTLLHDRPSDACRAAQGRYRAYRRRQSDMEAFASLNAE